MRDTTISTCHQFCDFGSRRAGHGHGQPAKIPQLAVVAAAVAPQIATSAVAQQSKARIITDLPKTPDAILTRSFTPICHSGYSKIGRHTSGRQKRSIYAVRGIAKSSGHYEIGHLIPLSLGAAHESFSDEIHDANGDEPATLIRSNQQ